MCTKTALKEPDTHLKEGDVSFSDLSWNIALPSVIYRQEDYRSQSIVGSVEIWKLGPMMKSWGCLVWRSKHLWNESTFDNWHQIFQSPNAVLFILMSVCKSPEDFVKMKILI